MNKRIIIIFFLLVFSYSYNIKYNITLFKEFINDCNDSNFYNKKFITYNNTNPYISICIPAYNMEKYIKKALLSIINQSFHDFEIIILMIILMIILKDILKYYN